MFRILLVTFFIILSGNALVQISTNSSYSTRGIGDVGFYGNAYLSGLGGAATALADSSQTNLYNPSTYALIAKQLPLFSIGVNHFEKKFSNNGITTKGRFSSITHMSLVVPFAKRFGIAAGLKPLSRSGYEINDAEMVEGDSIFYNYSGDGEIQEFLLGFSGTIIDRRKQSLSIGVNGKYYFGKINRERLAFKKASGVKTGGMESQAIRAKDFGIELGINYDYRFSRQHSLRFGGVYRLAKSIRSEQSQRKIYYGNYVSQDTYDTLYNATGIDGDFYLPAKTSVGLTYTFTPHNDSLSGNSKLRSYMFTLEYTMSDWSGYQETFDGKSETGQYINSDALRFGFEFKPHRIATDRSAYINILDKMNYRVGAYHVNTPHQMNGEQIVNQGVSIGLGLPLIISRAVSTLSISGSYGVMGKGAGSGVVKENYFGFNLGINIAPGYDKWFRKYKLD
ncbi:hypothetical protein CW751_13725 [Brumimicrobium salinarum]|uniref:DUF5723 domain-containing protein n=1 Tax=Brumimicrobium salinarum TaxID=2058658 RepID=A0A2I0QZC9_9FLAO|nr:hypothetical protein [Brumimicrobium salinarum]PKR79694.1 hypothetical protein CW751_13725 [Brumimicrobium salinarum]